MCDYGPVRENRGGTLYTLVYGCTITQDVDPMEKKPLFHFYPGSTAFSIATAGCNFRCRWCQNWEISQMPHEQYLIMGDEASPEEIGLAEGLCYVYMGNVAGEADTLCHVCGRLLIRRSGLSVVENHVGPGECCPACGTPVPGVGMEGASGKQKCWVSAP